jgi:tryptophan 2,3-dioxygenase
LLDRFEQKSVSIAFVEYRDHARAGVGMPQTDSPLTERIYHALLTFDNSVRSWRARHAALAELFLGGAQGTAGSSGAAYLWRSTERTLFPEIFSQQEWRDGECTASRTNGMI